MKKLFLTLAILTATLCSYGQKRFYVVNAEIVKESVKRYERQITADSVVVDSAQITINCWFGQEGNPYVQSSAPYAFCAHAQITRTVTGADYSKWLNKAKRLAEAYRKQVYPNVP